VQWSAALANKRVLQVAIVGSLLLISAIGEWQLTSRSWSLMRRALLAQALGHDAAAAAMLANVLEETAPGGSVQSGEGQRYAERLIEHLEVAPGAQAFLIDRRGTVLAHPVAAFVGAGWGAMAVRSSRGTLALAAALAQREALRGWAVDPVTGQTRLIAAHWSPPLDAAVCVTQDPESVIKRTQALSAFFLRTTFLLWAGLLVAVWFIVGTLVDRYESRIAVLARSDSLTGLGNRRRLDEVMARAAALQKSGGRGLAAIAVDLDDFKPINDRFGHAVGDRALQALAEALARLAPGMAFRLGGDEFLILLAGASEAEAEVALQRVRSVFPLQVRCDDGGELAVEGSAGFAHVAGGESPASLLADADRALYLHKSVRKNRRRRAGDLVAAAPPALAMER